MTSARVWALGARPRTLPASLVPVAVGGAAGVAGGWSVVSWRLAGALLVALALQVGVNYANDYSDGLRGTDAQRIGPTRLVAGHLATPGAVRRAALVAFGVAAAAGLALSLATDPWLLVGGAAALAAAWLYTGGPHPYGYAGFGEAVVFVFFGPAAVVGTAYVATGHWSALAGVASVPVGLLAVALLLANNVRDRAGDEVAGKRTLAVRLGDRWARMVYTGCAVVPLAFAAGLAGWVPTASLALLSAPLAWRPVHVVLTGATGRDLVPALSGTARLQIAFGLLLAAGFAVH